MMLPYRDWNNTATPYPLGQSIHEIFAKVAADLPQAPCLLCDGEQISYSLLDRAANAYAAHLADFGVGRGDLVPIRLPRSPELVAALLAVLKLGAAYALIDEAWPRNRVQDVVAQLGATVLVGVDQTPITNQVPVRIWTPPAGGLASVAGSAPDFVPAKVGGLDPACVFFTSGTTGRPKGVLSPHRATVRLFRPGAPIAFAPGTVMPQAAAVAWDGYSFELWSVLLNGGTSLIVAEPYISSDVLRAGIARHSVDTAFFTSSLFAMLVDEDPECMRGMRQIVVGGERLSSLHARRFLLAHPDTALFNAYGPIESTMYATLHRVTLEDCARPSGIPIGRPAPDTQVYILDGERRCEIGEVGELCIAGHGLALCYLGDPQLTSEKFAEATVDGTTVRLYRTGDLGCWDENGLLHFRGRLDRQVKIRGHRIEPAEVERQIERLLPEVRRCAVLALRDEFGVCRALAAFCQPRRAGDRLDGALQHLAPHLVHYQLPEYVLAVAEFPLTANGKLDEAALLGLARQLERPAEAEDASRRTPGDPLTDLVARTVANVLGVPGVSSDCEFTALGGTSLDAGRVCARLASRLGRPVPVSLLLRGGTVRDLAHQLREDEARTPRSSLTPKDVELVLSPAESSFLVQHLLDPDGREAHCLAAWVIDGPLDHAALNSAVTDVHRRHDALGSAYRLGRGRAFRLPVEAPAPEVVVLAECATVDEALASVRDALDAPLDPTAGHLWRVLLAPVGQSTSVIGYAVHHIAFDGWSEAVLAADLAAAYNARCEAREPSWAQIPSGVEVYALRSAHLNAADIGAQQKHVAERLRGVPELRFPHGSENTETTVLTTEFTVSPDMCTAVDALARSIHQTRFAVLLSCYARSLARTTGQDDFGIGVPVAQRTDERLEHTLGCHIGTVCVRISPSALDEDLVSSAAETGRLAREALGSQDVGINEVVRTINPPRSGRAPLFQTIFAYQDNAPAELALVGCRTTFHRLPYLGIPAEIQTEIWPADDGSLRVVINSRTPAVARSFAGELTSNLADSIADLSRRRPQQ